MPEYRFKQAVTPREFQQIHRLNHKTFAEEIRQHALSADGQLIDRFHESNRYFIALHNHQLAGMVGVHAGPVFSVTSRLPDPSLLSSLRTPLEVRLLAVDPRHRGSLVLPGILTQVYRYARRNHFSDLLISGIAHREGMYRKMGFRPLGPAVRSGEADYTPMRLSLDDPPPEFAERAKLYSSLIRRVRSISLMPGPVQVAPTVQRAFRTPPVSHRTPEFVAGFEELRSKLSVLMGGMHTVVLTGGGTLANDVVAANLGAAFPGTRGLVIANGEFGERLVRQAHLAGLSIRSTQFEWGEPWDFAKIEQELGQGAAWVWAVHLETSTGVLNDLTRLLQMADQRGIPVAADCVSSIGAVDTSLSGRLFLASGVSGKALGSLAGLAMVSASSSALDRLADARLCPTFDIAAAVHHEGPVSTVSTPMVAALRQAIDDNFATPAASKARFAHHRELGRWVRAQMLLSGLAPVAAESDAAPTITSFPMPRRALAQMCCRAGFRIASESEYLQGRHWGQIATMGSLSKGLLEPLFETIERHCKAETEDRSAS